jgi:hypothetical protein
MFRKDGINDAGSAINMPKITILLPPSPTFLNNYSRSC